MISLKKLMPLVSLRGVDISGMPTSKNLSWYNLSGAKCSYDKLGNRTWVQEGLILYSGWSLGEAILAQQYGDNAIDKARLSRRYCVSTTVVGYDQALSFDKTYKYVVTISKKGRRKKIKDTKPLLRGVNISKTDPDVDLSHFNLNGAFCDMEKLKNPSWVQDGLIIKSGEYGRAEDEFEDVIKYFETSGLASMARPKYNRSDNWTYNITIELLDRESKGDSQPSNSNTHETGEKAKEI